MQGHPMFLKSVREFFGIAPEPDRVPAEIREASHRLANAATELSAVARRLEREDPFHEFIHAMREKPGHGPH